MFFGVVGAGSAGSRHARNLLSLGHDVIICSEHSAFGNDKLDDLDYEKATSFRQLLDQKLDGIVIANSTSVHADYAIEAIQCGHNLYIEKPLTHTLSSALKLKEVAEKKQRAGAQIVIAVGNQHRFNPLLATVKGFVDQRQCGDILSVRCEMGEYLPFYHPGEDYSERYAARRDLGGGVLRTQVHDINYLQWIFGNCDVLVARGGRTSDLKIDVEDNVNAFLTSKLAESIFLHMDYLQRQPRRTLDISFEKGAVHWNYYANQLVIEQYGAEPIVQNAGRLERNDLFVSAIENFVASIERGVRPMTTLDEALKDVTVIDAIESYLDI